MLKIENRPTKPDAAVTATVAEEIVACGVRMIEHKGHREVWLRHTGSGQRVLDLRCADDVFLVGASVSGVGRLRPACRFWLLVSERSARACRTYRG
jgi:hypothetical protein